MKLDQSAVLGNAVITYSSGVVNQVLQSSATPTMMARRPWTELF